MDSNLDAKTVRGFGDEWSRFDQSKLDDAELSEQFERYFRVFPWGSLSANPVGFDLGCGSGRWAKLVALRVAKLHCIDASGAALGVAKQNLSGCDNVEFHEASVDSIPIETCSMDFGYSLGVLHHIPDTQAGIKACADKLKPGAPLLLYLYYAFDNRPRWYRAIWKISDFLRRAISAFPFILRRAVTDTIALFIYLPFATCASVLERAGRNVSNFPLSAYRRHSLYTMRTDALDRFGTRLETRYTQAEITAMMTAAGLERVIFSDEEPYWCAVGFKRVD
jgi:SAM-dependent methyltransferase